LSGNKVGWVSAYVANCLEESLSLADGRGMSQMNRLLSAQRVDIAQGLAQDMFVEEEDGIESLILATDGNPLVASQVSEESFNLLLTGKVFRHFGQRSHVTAQPKDVGVFSRQCLVLTADP